MSKQCSGAKFVCLCARVCLSPILIFAVLLSSVPFGFFRVGLRLQEGIPNIVGPHVRMQIIGKRQLKAVLISHTLAPIIS